MNHYTRPDWSHCALITIDMQNDFTWPGAIAEIQGTTQVIQPIEAMLHVFRQNRLPVIHIIRLYKDDGSNVDLCRREKIESGTKIVSPGTWGSKLIDPLLLEGNIEQNDEWLLEKGSQQLSQSEWIVYKPRWGAFYETDLDAILRQQGVNTVVVCGCNFPNCPRTSIYEASERDFKVIAVHDALSGIYDRGIQEMIQIGVHVCSANDVQMQLKSEEL